MNKTAHTFLVVFTIVATVGGLLTLIPWPEVSCFIRASLVKDQDGSVRRRHVGVHQEDVDRLLVLNLERLLESRLVRVEGDGTFSGLVAAYRNALTLINETLSQAAELPDDGVLVVGQSGIGLLELFRLRKPGIDDLLLLPLEGLQTPRSASTVPS